MITPLSGRGEGKNMRNDNGFTQTIVSAKPNQRRETRKESKRGNGTETTATNKNNRLSIYEKKPFLCVCLSVRLEWLYKEHESSIRYNL